MTDKYPTCELFDSFSKEISTLREFIDHLQSHGIILASYNHGDDLLPYRKGAEGMIMKFFGIDEDKLEFERTAIFKKLSGGL